MIRLSSRAVAHTATALVLAGCSFSPLNHHVKVGEEPFAIFVAEGIDHHTDLFAVPASGGLSAQVTFTPLIERHPRLSPNGDVVAFIRMRDTLPDAPHDVVLMNLLGGGEITIRMPDSAGTASAAAWSADGLTLFIQTATGTWQTPAPPAKAVVTRVAESAHTRADSALGLWLGRKRFARVISCGNGLCVIGAAGDTAELAPNGHDPIRWGADSVAWFEGDRLFVRGLGPGHQRVVTWREGPTHPRDADYNQGVAPADSL